MKVKIGDEIESVNFEGGTIVAMSKQWCIYKSCRDSVEFAVTWGEIYLPVDPPDEPISSIESKEI